MSRGNLITLNWDRQVIWIINGPWQTVIYHVVLTWELIWSHPILRPVSVTGRNMITEEFPCSCEFVLSAFILLEILWILCEYLKAKTVFGCVLDSPLTCLPQCALLWLPAWLGLVLCVQLIMCPHVHCMWFSPHSTLQVDNVQFLKGYSWVRQRRRGRFDHKVTRRPFSLRRPGSAWKMKYAEPPLSVSVAAEHISW